MLRTFLLRVARWCGPTLLLLAVLEGGATYIYPIRDIPIVLDPVLNHVWRPSSAFRTEAFAERGVPPYTRASNSQGWLSRRDFARQKSPRVFRIAYLGDSFVEGTCAEEDTVPEIVGSRLQVLGATSVEVINTGTSSYSPTLYYLLLKTKLLSYSPDLVVVNVDMSDVFDDVLYRATLKVDEQGEPIACLPGHPLVRTYRRTAHGLERLSLLQRALAKAAKHSSFVRFTMDAGFQMARHRESKESRDVPAAFAWCNHRRSEETVEDVAWSMAMLRRTIKLAKSRNIRVVITAVPHRQQLEGRWSLQPMADIGAVSQEEGVPFLNPVDAFRKKLAGTPPAAIYIPEDMHFNPKGYRMWAEIQLEFLSQLGLNQP